MNRHMPVGVLLALLPAMALAQNALVGTWTGKGEAWNVPVGNFDGDGVDEAAVMIQSGTPDKPSVMLGAAVTAVH